MATLQATTVSGTLSATGAAGFDNFIGMIAPFAMGSVPTGWLSCDGSAVSRTTYADLFGKISTTWGAGNGSTTFNVPDLRGAFVRGTGTNGDDSDQVGPSVGASQAAGNLTHTHTGPSHTHTGPSHTHTGPSHTHSISSGGSHNHSGRGLTNAHGYSFQGNPGSRNYTGYPNHGMHSLIMQGGDHTHTTNSSGTGATGSSGTGSTGASGTGATGADGTGATGSSGTGATGSNGAANARPYNYGITYCIKF